MEENQKRSTRRKNAERKRQIILIVIIIILIILLSTIIVNAVSNNKTKEAAYVSNENIIENNENIEKVNNIVVENEINAIEENLIIEKVNNIEAPPVKNDKGTRYRLEVNCEQNVVNVYEKDENGEYTNCIKAMLCSVGSATPTSGTYSLKKYGGWEWKALFGDVYGQYATQITGNILFHSVPYTEKYNKSSLEYWEYDKLGTPASMGCVRLTVRNAKWIYDNCATGTKVMFYSDSNPGPLGKPSEQKISSEVNYNSWDPTDPDSENPWRNYGKEAPPVSEKENKILENIEADDDNDEYVNDEINDIFINDIDNNIMDNVDSSNNGESSY